MNPNEIVSGSMAGGSQFGTSTHDESFHQAIARVRECFHRSIKPNYNNALAHGAPIAAMLVALTAIDYLASYFSGRDRGSDGFQAFFKEYIQPLAPASSSGYDPRILYRNLRNGLFHNFVTAKTPARHYQLSDLTYVLVDDPSSQAVHLTEGGNGKRKVLFHIPVFLTHVNRASEKYFSDLESDGGLQSRFMNWYREAGYLIEIDLNSLQPSSD